ncbi:MAG: radical SAM protein [Candidatus Lokiarchaeota archaeon]|nr:radical SAM protein [Candidatus Lokiarchaeota archaeon]MBD3338408.1 radical SAM protein [Candidatus Lokiarchaeota archaeon]
MSQEIIYVDQESNIPLFGLDFIGLIDRGTNVIELKPLTLCNLKCRYCFVSAGAYQNNFIVSSDYLIATLKKVINVKGKYDIEVHIAPYGEILLYSELFSLLKKLNRLKGIDIISMQTNGLLLNAELIKNLEILGLTRINLSLNTFNSEKAAYFCDTKNYDIDTLRKIITLILKSNIDLLLAPVWFPGENDEDIEEIISFVKKFRKQGHNESDLQIGIQKYLIYKTGRKLKKIRPKTWGYFYKQLSELEQEFDLKLKLGPIDFGIHPRKLLIPTKFKKGDKIATEIVSKGRWDYECIGKIRENIGIKILLQKPWKFSSELLGQTVQARIIKANYKDNIITAVSEF